VCGCWRLRPPATRSLRPTPRSDELGDPCCEWNFGTAPRLGGAHLGSVTSPVHASSVPRDRTSCSSRLGLVGPQVAAVWRSADGGVALAWASEGPQCVCEFLVNVTVGSQPPAVYTVRATPGATISGQPQALQLCGAAGLVAVVASVAAVNRAGVSAWSAPAVLPAGAPSSNYSASAALAGADGAGGCGLGVLQSGSAMNSAGSTSRAYVPVRWLSCLEVRMHRPPFATPRPSRPADVNTGPGAGSEPLGHPRTARARSALPGPRPLVSAAEVSGGA